MDFSVIIKILPFVASGLFVTLKYALCALFLGLPLGIVFAIAKSGDCCLLKKMAHFYTAIFRGTPLIVQFSLIYYATPQLFDVKLSLFQAGILAFSLNSAAYSSEVIRAGIASVERGQWEAAKVLGMTRAQTWRHVILPQAFRTSLPSLINEIINLIKESAIVSFFGEMDIMKKAQIITAEKFIYFEPYITAAFVYFFVVTLLSILGRFLEKRYAIYS